jgi:hypothetical protein
MVRNCSMNSFLDTDSLNIDYLRPRGTTLQPVGIESGENSGLLAGSMNENIDKLRLLGSIIVKGCDLSL